MMEDNFHDIDGWAEFLAARMRVLRSAASKEYTPSQAEALVNIEGMQTRMLLMRAAQENQHG